MRRYREVEDFQPEIMKAFESRGWLCEKYPGNGRPDLIATKHPYGAWVETKVIHTDSKKKRLLDHFTHAQVPTYLDYAKRGVLTGIYIAVAFVTDEVIDYRLHFVKDKHDAVTLTEIDIDQFRLGTFACFDSEDLVSQIIQRRFT